MHGRVIDNNPSRRGRYRDDGHRHHDQRSFSSGGGGNNNHPEAYSSRHDVERYSSDGFGNRVTDDSYYGNSRRSSTRTSEDIPCMNLSNRYHQNRDNNDRGGHSTGYSHQNDRDRHPPTFNDWRKAPTPAQLPVTSPVREESRRPSATSAEYEGPSSTSAVSIHNMIERQSWETRTGVANSFDPTLRGYNISRRYEDGSCEEYTARQSEPEPEPHPGNRSEGRGRREDDRRHHDYDNSHGNHNHREDDRRRSRSRSRSRSNSFPTYSNTITNYSQSHSQRARGYDRDYRRDHCDRYPSQYQNCNSLSHHNQPNGIIDPPSPNIQYIPPSESSQNYDLFMIILVGLPGAGKTTFANALSTSKPWKYVRINQDTLGSRVKCESLTRETLKNKRIPIIDRCNFNPTQRKSFLSIAQDFNIQVDCVVFTYSMEICVKRCQIRKNHETITPGIEYDVVSRMVGQFCPPLPNRINAEKFRTLRNVTDVQMSNDLVLEYLSNLF